MTDPRFPVPPGAGGRHRRADETPALSAPGPATTVAPPPPPPPVAEPASAAEPAAPPPAPAEHPEPGTAPKKKLQPQPVLTASAVQTLLAAAVTVGWVQLDDATVATLATVIAAMVAGFTTWLARGKVTPTSSPRDNTGRPLT